MEDKKENNCVVQTLVSVSIELRSVSYCVENIKKAFKAYLASSIKKELDPDTTNLITYIHENIGYINETMLLNYAEELVAIVSSDDEDEEDDGGCSIQNLNIMGWVKSKK